MVRMGDEGFPVPIEDDSTVKLEAWIGSAIETLYISKAGSVVDEDGGVISVDLSMAESNLPAGSYNYHFKVFDADDTEMGVAASGVLEVISSPNSANADYVGTSPAVVWGGIGGDPEDNADLQALLDAKANDSEVVKLTGDQSIAGNKTFTGITVVDTDLYVGDKTRPSGEGWARLVRTATAALFQMNRASGTGFASFNFKSAGVDVWSFGVNADSGSPEANSFSVKELLGNAVQFWISSVDKMCRAVTGLVTPKVQADTVAGLALKDSTGTTQATIDGNGVNLTNVRGMNTAGVTVKNHNGDNVALLGAGGSDGATFYGQVNVEGLAINGDVTVDTYEQKAQIREAIGALAADGDGSGLTGVQADTSNIIEIINQKALRTAVSKMRSQRVAIVGIGDSNQLKDGHGWAEAFAKSFGDQFGWFGSGVLRNRYGTPANSFIFKGVSNSATPESYTKLPEEIKKYRQSGEQTSFFLASGESRLHNGTNDYFVYSNSAQASYPDDFDMGNSIKMDVSYVSFKTKYKSGLTATDAVWQSSTNVRYSITEDLGISHAGMYILASGFANASNNGTFKITSVGTGYVDVTSARTDGTDDEATVSALVDIEQDQTGTAGDIRTMARRAESPYTTIPDMVQVVGTLADDYAVADLSTTVDADAARSVWGELQLGYIYPGGTVYGPVYLTGMQVTSPDVLSGIAYSTLIYQGGKSMQDFYETLYNSDDAMLVEYWRQIRLNLNGDKSAIVVINGGLNDKNETDLSPVEGYAGDSAEAYKERVELIIDRLIATWVMVDEKGGRGDQDDLTIVVMPSHPISTPADSELASYRLASKTIPLDYPNVCFLMINELVPQADFVSGGYYQSSGSDTSHLERVGYRAVADEVVEFVK